MQRWCNVGAEVQVQSAEKVQRCAAKLVHRCTGGAQVVQRWCRGGAEAQVQRCYRGAGGEFVQGLCRCCSKVVQRCRCKGGADMVQRCRRGGAEMCRGAAEV